MGKGGQQPPKLDAFAADPRISRSGGPLITAERKTLVCAVLDKDKLPSKSQIRDSIPPHCFEHSYVSAFAHVVRDTAVVAMFAFLAASLLRTSDMTLVDILGWQAYAFFQGAALTGWWVIAHECGHGGVSASQFVNDCAGLVLHSVQHAARDRGGRLHYVI